MRRFIPFVLLAAFMATLAPARAAAPSAIPAAPPITSGLALWFNAARSAVLPATSEGRWIRALNAGDEESEQAWGPAPVVGGRASLLNGMAAVQFNGNGPYFKANVDIRAITNPNVTIFAVYSFAGRYLYSGATSGIFGNDNANWDRFLLVRLDNGEGCVSSSMGLPPCLSVSGLQAPGPHVVSVRYTLAESSGQVRLDGPIKRAFNDGSDPEDARRTFIIGADGDNNPFDGQIGEVLVYTRALTNSEIAAITKYLATKYSISIVG